MTSARKANLMWRSLSQEILPIYGLDPYDFAFTARKYSTWRLMRHQESLASTHYGLMLTSEGFGMEPTGVSINGDILKWAHEDEVEGIIRHEIAHCIAGWDADHGRLWKRVCREIGAVPSYFYVLRDWRKMPPRYQPDEWTVQKHGPTFGEVA